MPISCPDCAAPMPDDAAFCPECGCAVHPVERAHGTVGALPEVIAGALAYFFVPAIVFLLIEPYRKNRFVRFHSVQCIVAWLAAIVITTVVKLVTAVLGFIPLLGNLLVWLLSLVVSLAFLTIWILLIVKALQGERFELPLIGNFAEQQAETI